MCIICGSPEAESHFGGVSCRACAAFFRRFFHSKKIPQRCTCKVRDHNSHPCRVCRIQKCLEAGMSSDKVQVGRDKHSRKLLELVESPSSLLQTRIISRDSSNLFFADSNWDEFESMRDQSNGGKIGWLNLYEASSTVKTEIELTWRMVLNMFPAMEKLKQADKSALLHNFIPKLWQIGPVLDHIKNAETYENMTEEDYNSMVLSFYQGSFEEGEEMSDKEILRTFHPFWWYYYTKMILPIVWMDLERTELMAVIWLLFFDNGYTNISVECQEMCRTMRKMIYLELKNYQKSREFDEMRFIETVETLEIIERGEKKFMEEMMICEMSNIRIHDDFRKILRENKL